MTSEGLRCADAAEARDEPLYGTASVVRRWLLLEQPGSWGYDALTQSRLPEDIGRELRQRGRRAGVRVILIRRGRSLSSHARQCYLIRTDADGGDISHLALDELEHVLDLDLTAWADGAEIPRAESRRDALFLICTHGRHDACCSIRGNQVSRVACAQPDHDAWECSHIGGDRFAANLVCFPHGVYYGRVAADQVRDLMDAYAAGDISLEHYRGRCCYPFALQAAEYFVRREGRVTRVDDVTVREVAVPSDGELVATFGLADGRVGEIEVAVGQTQDSYRLTCGSAASMAIPRYDLVSCKFR